MNDKILTIKKSTLVDIANEVIAKTGSTDLIKVADLDDAVKELSGGGIVEVDVLPEIFFAGDSIPVPSSQIERKQFTYEDGYVENIAMPTGESVICDSLMFNTSLSIDEVVNEIKKVSVDMDNTYPVKGIGCSFTIECYGNNNEYLMNVHMQNILNASYVDGTFVRNHSDDYRIGYADGISGESFDIFNTQDGGWNQEFVNMFNGVIEIPQNTTHVIAYINWFDAEDEAQYGFMSDKSKDITNLLMATERVKNPECNLEAVYKLPDETLWMVENNEWVQLSKGGSESSFPIAEREVTIYNHLGYDYALRYSLDLGKTWNELPYSEENSVIVTTQNFLPVVGIEDRDINDLIDNNHEVGGMVLIDVEMLNEDALDSIELEFNGSTSYTYGNRYFHSYGWKHAFAIPVLNDGCQIDVKVAMPV